MGISHNAMLATVIRVIAQTLVQGIFVALMPVVSTVLLRQRGRTPNLVLFWLTFMAFILSTGYWGMSAAFLMIMASSGSVPHHYDAAQSIFNAVIFLNFLLADGVVVWRMYVLCALHFPRKVLLLPLLLYAALCVSVLGTITLRIVATATQRSTSTPFNIFQACGNFLSLATNLAATSIICVWAYQQQHTLKRHVNDRTCNHATLDKIILILAETGIVYCFFSATLVIVQDIHIPLRGNIIDIYKPVHSQLAGLYPALVVHIISSQGPVCPADHMTNGILSEDYAGHVTSLTDSQIPTFRDSRSV